MAFSPVKSIPSNLESININSLYKAFMENSNNLGKMLHIQGQQSLPGTGSNLKQMPYKHCPESARCWSKLLTPALYAYRPNFSKCCP